MAVMTQTQPMYIHIGSPLQSSMTAPVRPCRSVQDLLPGHTRHFAPQQEEALPVVRAPAAQQQPELPEGTVTVMMRQLNRKYTQDELKAEIEASGFRGAFNFIYVPWDIKHKRNRGFAFINFVEPGFAVSFHAAYHNGHLLQSAQQPLCIVEADLQGLQALVVHFQSRPTEQMPWFSTGKVETPQPQWAPEKDDQNRLVWHL